MSWERVLEQSLNSLNPSYKEFLDKKEGYFPLEYLRAFEELPKSALKRILFGQDPYPRVQSAIGVSFIDGAVKSLWGQNGLSKEVNRATSLRNFIKMQLVAEGLLQEPTQEQIAKLDKSGLVESIFDLKDAFLREGVLLLNMALIFTNKDESRVHVQKFEPFVKALLNQLSGDGIELILFGKLALRVEQLLPKEHKFKIYKFAHPYNLGFIADPKVQEYFKNLKLIRV